MLHENRLKFYEVLEALSNETGIRADILEKDYYVTLLLRELSRLQSCTPVYFKGGTALYKISGKMMRFSEDIDLTVRTVGLNNSQSKKLLKSVSEKYTSLPRLCGDLMEENKKGSITTVYGYDSLYPLQMDSLQRYGKVKVEATSFTVSDPVSTHVISPLIYQVANGYLKAELQDVECGMFNIQTISIERIFADKLLAAEFYLERGLLIDVSKHLYDIVYLMTLPEIQNMLLDPRLLIYYLAFKRLEEQARIGSDLSDKPLADLAIHTSVQTELIKSAYDQMLQIYVFQEKYKISFPTVQESFKDLSSILCAVSSREQDFLHSKYFTEFTGQYHSNSKNISKLGVFSKNN